MSIWRLFSLWQRFFYLRKRRQKHRSKTHLSHLRPGRRRYIHRWPEYSKPQGSRLEARNFCAVPGLHTFSAIREFLRDQAVIVSQFVETQRSQRTLASGILTMPTMKTKSVKPPSWVVQRNSSAVFLTALRLF